MAGHYEKIYGRLKKHPNTPLGRISFMELNIRKTAVGALALAIVVSAYVLHTWFSDSSEVDIGAKIESGFTDADRNISPSDGEVGKIGDVGVEKIQDARYERLNENNEIERIFGFKELLYKVGDEWEIEKPFMDIFRPAFKCSITSDKGKVKVETVVGKHTPKDATLTGNVVIHILPRGSASVEECTIYLDDITFVSENSQLSTPGPVRFVSDQVQLIGTGMELVYNEQENKLELLKIADLRSLRWRIESDSPLLSSSKQTAKTGASPHDAGKRAAPSSPTQTRGEVQPGKEVDSPPPQEAVGEYYRIRFAENVIVETPEHLAFADQLSIGNVLLQKGFADQSKPPADSPAPGEAHVTPASDAAQKTATAANCATDESDAQFVDIIVTCDGGIVVAPMSFRQQPFRADEKTTVTGGRGLRNYGDTGGRATAVARKINYCALAEEVTLEGDCYCAMPRQDAGYQRKDELSGPRIWVKLAGDKDKQTPGPADNIEHLTAEGGMVKLATVKKLGEELLGFTKLECSRFDFDPPTQVALAAGPNCRILVDNSKVSPTATKEAGFGLRKQCYAAVEKFDTFKYFLDSNRIVLDSKSEKIQLGYFPSVKGKLGKEIYSSAGHVEATLFETPDGRSELSTLKATGGVIYEEKAEQTQQGSGAIIFVGSEFFLDAVKGELKAWGDESQNCLLNGAAVDGIRYNLNTGEIAAELVAPGTVRMK